MVRSSNKQSLTSNAHVAAVTSNSNVGERPTSGLVHTPGLPRGTVLLLLAVATASRLLVSHAACTNGLQLLLLKTITQLAWPYLCVSQLGKAWLS